MSILLSARGCVRGIVVMAALLIGTTPLSAGTPSNPQLKDTSSPSVAAEPFGFGTQPLSDGGLHMKWQNVSRAVDADLETIRRCRSDRAQCTPAALRLIGIIDSARQRDGLARLGEVNRAINLAIRPVSDERQYGIQDHWSAPLATLTSGAGDCEDYAIAKLVALREAGVAQSDLRLIIVRDHLFNEDHAVLAARFEGRWRILDNRRLAMIEDDQMRQTEPLFAIDQDGVRRFTDPNMMIATTKDQRLPPVDVAAAAAVTEQPTEIALASQAQADASLGFEYMTLFF